jgi:hypothetical protein
MGKRRKADKGRYGPALNGRNIAPELRPHVNGPRYLPNAKTSSSQRAQIGSVAAEYADANKTERARKKQRGRVNHKRRKQSLILSKISLEGTKPMDRDATMNTKFTYFNGGVEIPFDDENEIVYLVNEQLKVINNPQSDDHNLGLIYQRPNSISADIILCPRKHIISRGHNNCDELCDAFDVVLGLAPVTKRESGSKSQNVTTDVNKPVRYCCIGTHVNMGNGGGITPFSAALEGTDDKIRKIVRQFVASIEHLFCAYVSNEEISIVTRAIALVDAPTMTMPPSASNPRPKKAKVYGAMAVGVDVCLATHTDKDFTFSAISVKCRSDCHPKERILVYFAFPALGIAIPLRVGDVLFFNPNEPHCITSRVSETDSIYIVSLYLKSAVIGLNNNSIPLTVEQKSVLEYKNNKM